MFGLLFLCFIASAKGQSILKLKQPHIYITSSYAVAAFGGGYLYSTTVKGLNSKELSSVSINNLSKFNQRAAQNYNLSARNWSDFSVISTAALPSLFSLHKRVRGEFFTYNTIYAQALLSSIGQVLLVKSLSKKNRPYVYNPNVAVSEKMKSEARFSFPSGHTAIAATATYFFASTYSLYFPDSDYKAWVWLGAAVLPIVTGYLRYEAGRHFVSDIVGGYAIGAANGIIFPLLFRVGK